MRFAPLLAAAAMTVAMPAVAQTVTVTPGANAGSQTDALNGATVTDSSPILQGFSVQDAFGAVTQDPTYPESAIGGNVIFADGANPNFIDFQIAAPTAFTGFNIFASSDGANNPDRQFTTVTLFAGTAADSLTSLGTATLGVGASTVNYSFSSPQVYQFFRFEGTNFSNGARLLEIDSLGVPEPSTWALMIMGFGMVGAGMRSARRRGVLAAA